MNIDPFILDETSPGAFSLLLRDLDSYSSVFEAKGHSGSGYSWEADGTSVMRAFSFTRNRITV